MDTYVSTNHRCVIELDGGTFWTASIGPVAQLASEPFAEVRRRYADKLDGLKQEAVANDESAVFLNSVDGTSWEVLPRAEYTANIHFSWSLVFRGIHVSIHRTPSETIPGVRTRIEACALREFGLRGIDSKVSNLLRTLGIQFQNQVYSRLDVNLTSTESAWDVRTMGGKLRRGEVVCKFKVVDTKGTIDSKKALTFGRYPNTELQIYNKSKELNKLMNSKDLAKAERAREKYFQLTQVLGTANDMTRIEWRIGRIDLAKYEINTTSDIENKLSGVVMTLFDRLRFTSRVPSAGNAKRTPTWDVWEVIKEQFRVGCVLMFDKEISTEHNKHYKAIERKELRRTLKESKPRSQVLSTASAYLAKLLTYDDKNEEHKTLAEVKAYILANINELTQQVATKYNELVSLKESNKRLTKEQQEYNYIQSLTQEFDEFADWGPLPVDEPSPEDSSNEADEETRDAETTGGLVRPDNDCVVSSSLDFGESSPLPALSSPEKRSAKVAEGGGTSSPLLVPRSSKKPVDHLHEVRLEQVARPAVGGTIRHELEPQQPQRGNYRMTPPASSAEARRPHQQPQNVERLTLSVTSLDTFLQARRERGRGQNNPLLTSSADVLQ